MMTALSNSKFKILNVSAETAGMVQGNSSALYRLYAQEFGLKGRARQMNTGQDSHVMQRQIK